MNENSFKVVLIATAVLLMGLLVAQIRRRTRRFLNSAEVCLLRELVRSAQAGELQQEDQPKSLSGMTSIYLPQILRDFPEFNWEEMREIGESDTDVVRKLYGKLRTREGREQQSDILVAYLENYDLPGEVQAQIEQLEVRLLNYPSPEREEDRSI